MFLLYRLIVCLLGRKMCRVVGLIESISFVIHVLFPENTIQIIRLFGYRFDNSFFDFLSIDVNGPGSHNFLLFIVQVCLPKGFQVFS